MNTSFRYIAFYKPYGILSQFTGDKIEETLSQFNLPKNIYAVGRLDKDSEGLLLLSDDGDFIETLLNPKNEKEKTYWVEVENIPSEDDLDILRNGNIEIDQYKTKKAKVKRLGEASEINIAPRNPPVRFRKNIPTYWLEIIITEGKNRQVRRMTASINHPTLRLIRKKIGKLSLDQLESGQWRDVKKSDII